MSESSTVGVVGRARKTVLLWLRNLVTKCGGDEDDATRRWETSAFLAGSEIFSPAKKSLDFFLTLFEAHFETQGNTGSTNHISPFP